MDITNYTVTEVVGQIFVGAGPRGTDSVSLQYWLLRFGATSGELRLIVAESAEWLSNGWPPWDDYRAMVSDRLITLYKQPGV